MVIAIIDVCLLISSVVREYLGSLFNLEIDKMLPIVIAITIPLIVWCMTSAITARNIIKQHSMAVLLQTRTSAEYIKHAEVASKVLDGNQNEESKFSIIYMLNFLEFIAIGIKRCDLDESVLKDAWKGLVKRTVDIHGKGIINDIRTLPNAGHTWEHLLWLNRRWQGFPISIINIFLICSNILILATVPVFILWLVYQMFNP